MYNEDSYRKHGEWFNALFPGEEAKRQFYKNSDFEKNTIGNWIHNIFFSCLIPLLNEENQSWLTVGDAYGYDASFIAQTKNQFVEATDLNSDFLEVAFKQGIIRSFSAQNAEHLSFDDNRFDYVFCKEAYHHFPRPYSALYEMVRVSKKGIVIIEPQDPISRNPALLWLINVLDRIDPHLGNRFWKNRFSYEPVGNYVYKVSEREFQKFAAALNLNTIAFKQINPNFYSKKVDGIPATNDQKLFRTLRKKKSMLDLLTRLAILPGQVLATIIFKKTPDPILVSSLRQHDFKIINIPKNPYV